MNLCTRKYQNETVFPREIGLENVFFSYIIGIIEKLYKWKELITLNYMICMYTACLRLPYYSLYIYSCFECTHAGTCTPCDLFYIILNIIISKCNLLLYLFISRCIFCLLCTHYHLIYCFVQITTWFWLLTFPLFRTLFVNIVQKAVSLITIYTYTFFHKCDGALCRFNSNSDAWVWSTTA